MNDIPEDEARQYLAQHRHCEDAEQWSPCSTQKGTFEINAGLLDADKTRTTLFVQLIYRHSTKTRITRYIFSVFKRQPWGLERVYQLDVMQATIAIRTEHDKPHEHIGKHRMSGNATWQEWSFEQVLAHFCQQANLSFSPIIEHPLTFSLKG